jgi:hypothetical protein
MRMSISLIVKLTKKPYQSRNPTLVIFDGCVTCGFSDHRLLPVFDSTWLRARS